MWVDKDFVSIRNEPLPIREEYEKKHKNTIIKCFNENIRKNTSMYFSCNVKYSFMKSMIVILKNDLKSKGYKNIDIELFKCVDTTGDYNTYISDITFTLSEIDNPNINKYE